MAEFFYYQNTNRELHFHRLIPNILNGNVPSYTVNTVTYINRSDGSSESPSEKWAFLNRKTSVFTSDQIDEWLKKDRFAKKIISHDINEISQRISELEQKFGISSVESNLAFVC